MTDPSQGFTATYSSIFSQLSAVTQTTSDSPQPGQGDGGEGTTVELPKASTEALQFIEEIGEWIYTFQVFCQLHELLYTIFAD